MPQYYRANLSARSLPNDMRLGWLGWLGCFEARGEAVEDVPHRIGGCLRPPRDSSALYSTRLRVECGADRSERPRLERRELDIDVLLAVSGARIADDELDLHSAHDRPWTLEIGILLRHSRSSIFSRHETLTVTD
jgi:hypothetical protein